MGRMCVSLETGGAGCLWLIAGGGAVGAGVFLPCLWSGPGSGRLELMQVWSNLTPQLNLGRALRLV